MSDPLILFSQILTLNPLDHYLMLISPGQNVHSDALFLQDISQLLKHHINLNELQSSAAN